MNKVQRYSVDARHLHPKGFLTGQGIGEVVYVEEFDKVAGESQANANALAAAQKEIATLRAMLGMTPEWMALNGPGQVKQGTRFALRSVTARSKRKRNWYFTREPAARKSSTTVGKTTISSPAWPSMAPALTRASW